MNREQAPRLWRLENGLQLLVQEDRRFPLAVMRMYVRAGSAMELEGEEGASHLLEHMAFKGSGSAGGRASEIESLGGRINAATGFESTVYMLDLPSSAWRKGMQVLQGLCFQADWQESELETEKEVVLSELQRNRDNPGRVLFEGMQSLVWSGTGYSRPIGGREETVRGLDRRQLMDYVGRLYQPQSMLLVVCGDVDPEEVLGEAEKLFSGYVNDRPVETESPQPVSPAEEGPLVQVTPTSWDRAYVGIGFPLQGMAGGDAQAMEILAYLLGGDESSRLSRRFKHEMALVDEISASPIMLRNIGMFVVQAYLDPDRVREFVKSCFGELTGLEAESFSEEEVERAKLNIQDSLFQTRETLSGLASKLGHFQFLEGDAAEEEKYLRGIKRCRRGDLEEVIRQCLSPEGARIKALVREDRAAACQGLQQELAGSVDGNREAGTVQRRDRGGTRVKELANGCRLVIIPDETLPYLAMDLTWPGGDLLLGPEEQGLASLVASGLLRGTETLGHSRIRQELSARAADVEAGAGRDQFGVTAKFPSRFQSEVLDLVQEILQGAAFPEEETARVVAEQKAFIAQRSDQPMGRLSREVFPFLFRDHAYGYYHLGVPEELESFSSDSLRGFWERQRREPWVLTVCGDGDLEDIERRARQWAEMSRAPGSVSFREPGWSERSSLSLPLGSGNQAHILILFPVPGLLSDAYPHLLLWERILAGQEGILFRELRDRQGLGYAVSPLLWNAPSCGFLGFYLGTDPEHMEQAERGFREIVEAVGEEGISPQELERAKHMYQADYYRQLQPLMSRSCEASEMMAYGLPQDFQRRTAERVARIGEEELREVAARYLRWDRSYKMVMGGE